MSENYLRLGLLLIAVTIVFLILLEAWHRRRSLQMMKIREYIEPVMEETITQTQTLPPKKQITQPIIMLSVLAKPQTHFASYDLVQSILATGLKFGEGNLFHFYDDVQETHKLFSLASATQTGEFDLDHIGDLTCRGLILFFDVALSSDPQKAFDVMLETAEQLADDLDGELRADLNTPWTAEVYQRYQQQLDQHQMIA